MPFNGSGVFLPVSLPGSWNPAQTGQDATPADWNTLLADLAGAGLSNVICNDGQSTVTADIPFGGHKLTNVGDPTADTDALNRQSSWYIFDEQSITAKPKKRGRPSTGGRDPMIGARFPATLTEEIDKWAATNGDIGRSEAMRRLVELGLKSKARKQ